MPISRYRILTHPGMPELLVESIAFTFLELMIFQFFGTVSKFGGDRYTHSCKEPEERDLSGNRFPGRNDSCSNRLDDPHGTDMVPSLASFLDCSVVASWISWSEKRYTTTTFKIAGVIWLMVSTSPWSTKIILCHHSICTNETSRTSNISKLWWLN